MQAAQGFITALTAACQLATAGCLAEIAAPQPLIPPAYAVLNSPNAQIPRSVDSALRRAIPAFNPEVKQLQGCLEDITFKLRIPQRKPWGTMQGDVTKAQVLLSKRDQLLGGTAPDQADYASTLADDIEAGLRSVTAAIDARDPDKTSLRANKVLRDIASLELVQAPGIPYLIPKEYASRPRLNGRAVVDIVIERPNRENAYLTRQGGGLQPQAKLQLVIDGYSAPVTAGNFIQNVQNGMYENTTLNSSYVSVTVGPSELRPGGELPLEILPLGGYEPIYRSALDVASGELPVLPLSIYGAVAMSHPAGEAEGLASSDQFFLYKFDRSASGLAGLAFDEGTFGVFGYVTQGAELLQQLSSGDVIKQMTLISGGNRLQTPEAPTSS